MIQFESPINFETTKKYGSDEIKYFDLFETSQGGPEVGKLNINGIRIEGNFGGPCIIKNDHLVLTSWVRCWFVYKFRISIISLKTLKIEYLGNCKNLIYLNKIEGNIIYFYEDLDKSSESRLSYHGF
jgi:hypothetical protein